MKSLLNQIDETIGSIYNLDLRVPASSFITNPNDLTQPGALLIRESPSNQFELEVGIAFQEHITQELGKMSQETFSEWNLAQLRAFSVATEEISHFRYLVHHSATHRTISQIELEFQAELDRFLIFYLFHSAITEPLAECFDLSFRQLFENWSLSNNLTTEEKERYLEAGQLAKEFLHKHRQAFTSVENFSKFLGELRAFYRMSPQDKFSLIHRL